MPTAAVTPTTTPDPLPLTSRSLAATRRALIRRIQAIVSPVLRDSGYRTGPIGQSRPYRIAALTAAGASRPVRAFTFDAVIAFTEDGLMTDAEGGGCVTTAYADMPLDDLLVVLRLAEREVPKIRTRQARARPIT